MSNASTPRHLDFFVETSLETLQVNTSLGNDNFLEDYEFLGRVLGKTMYECILVDPQFSLPFLNKILGKQNSLDDLKNLDPEYYKHLKSLRYMSSNDISSLGLTFETTISSAARYGHSTLELIPGGRDIAVTKGKNCIEFTETNRMHEQHLTCYFWPRRKCYPIHPSRISPTHECCRISPDLCFSVSQTS